ncbi:MAG: hypothetical protein CMB34_05070 [Euryarchaeota archaeon]|nr:hypothetical protein [Euryarchaeota archaeon]
MLKNVASKTPSDRQDADVGKVVQLNASGQIPSLYITNQSVSLSDGRHLALEIADLKGAALNYGSGQADPFDADTVGSTSTNETYDDSNDWYSTISLTNEGTFGLTGGTNHAAWGELHGNGRHIGHKDFAGTSGVLESVKVNVDSVAVAFNATVSIYSVLESGSPGSIVGGASDPIAIDSIGNKTFRWSSNAPTLVAGTEYWFICSDVSGGFGAATVDYAAHDGSHVTGNHDTITSITGNTGATMRLAFSVQNAAVNMTLINSGLTAATAPTRGRISVQAQFVESATINTDLTAEISRDGGTTYTAVTLTAGAVNSNFTMFSGEADISAQPSGTSMKYRVKTLNNKNIRVSGVVLRWS